MLKEYHRQYNPDVMLLPHEPHAASHDTAVEESVTEVLTVNDYNDKDSEIDQNNEDDEDENDQASGE